MHEPAWDRWRWKCSAPGCAARGLAWRAPPAAPCALCGGALEADREEAVLDLEVRSSEVPKLYLDVTVRHAVHSDQDRLLRAANNDGATNKEADADKEARYPALNCPYKALPLALETFGRHGKTSLKHLRKLARVKASRLEEGGEDAASALVLRWAKRLSVALHRATARNLRNALGEVEVRERSKELAAELAS